MCRNCVEGICQNKCVAPEPIEVNFKSVKREVGSEKEVKPKATNIKVKMIF